MDFSETGLVSLLTNFVVIFMAVMAFREGRIFLKERKKFASFLVFGILLILTLTAGIITSLLAADALSLILSGFFLVTLVLGLKFKKTVSIFWAVLILLGIALFLSFFSYLVSGEEGKVLARVSFASAGEKSLRMTLIMEQSEDSIEIPLQGDMAGFEAYQMILKPYMGFLFGGKRMLITAVFSEKFNADYTRGELVYTPLEEGFFNKRTLWKSLEKKAVLLPGVKGVQRVMVSVYPEAGKTYELKMTHQGLILVKP